MENGEWRTEKSPCKRKNQNPRKNHILDRWEREIPQDMEDRWEDLGFTTRQQMERAIRENLYSRRSEAVEEAWGYKEDWSLRAEYPMYRKNTFQPNKEEGRKGGNMVRWKPLTAWLRQTGVGPRKMQDEQGRRKITIFMQPKGNHSCRTMLFSGCWQCWPTNCRTCQYMYENGAERWGPGACDRCPDLEEYEETEEDSRYKAKKGTNEPEGWTKRNSIKWIWIFDKEFQENPPEEEGESQQKEQTAQETRSNEGEDEGADGGEGRPG